MGVTVMTSRIFNLQPMCARVRVCVCVCVGGGRFCSLPLDFLGKSKMTADIDAKLSVPCSTSI